MTTLISASHRALVLFSGGQDSATCLAWALNRFKQVETLAFNYGQRHSVELNCRVTVLTRMAQLSPDWATRLGEDHVLPLTVLGDISETALTRNSAITMQADGLPNTFVPGRNLVFLTLAAALAYRRGIDTLVGGMCETDFSGYPDCRHETLEALQQALRLGMARPALHLATPLMQLSKAQTWQLAHGLGGDGLIEIIRTDTHTCYLGERGPMHEWGHGCGHCPACQLRARGYDAWRYS